MGHDSGQHTALCCLPCVLDTSVDIPIQINNSKTQVPTIVGCIPLQSNGCIISVVGYTSQGMDLSLPSSLLLLEDPYMDILSPPSYLCITIACLLLGPYVRYIWTNSDAYTTRTQPGSFLVDVNGLEMLEKIVIRH